ncbi:glutamine synthetase [Xylariaceae sp. FL0016]|nr:glutamine synthetase [Xylariaceae sp. FL0016]
MATVYHYRQLDAAIDETPIIDNHAHPLLKPENMNKHPLLTIATEANGEALEDTWSSLAHIRAVKQLAHVLKCEPTWEAVASSIEQKRKTSPEAWTRKCMEGIETILVDDGLGTPSEFETYAWHDSFTTSKCKRIVRIESVAEDIIAGYCDQAPSWEGEVRLHDFMQDFTEQILRSISDPRVVGFKSVICYRGGLDVPLAKDIGSQGPELALKAIIAAHLSGKCSFHSNKRLQHGPLNHLIVHILARLIRDTDAPFRKPIQFHTGLGDNDIMLNKSSPSHLQAFIREFPTVPIVLLHTSYPFAREAGYLAAMYANVYADIGEVFPFLSRHGQEGVIKEILELCPWSKIMWSTDGHLFPETYILATTQMRSVLKTVLGELVFKRQLSEEQAVQLVQDILFTNAKKLYNLEIKTSLSTYSQLTAGTVKSWSVEAVIQKLRAMDAKFIRLQWHDYTTSARCRLVPIKQVYKAFENGKDFKVSIAAAAFGLLQNDHLIPQVNASGVYTLYPDWTSLKSGPIDGHVSCYGNFKEIDGSDSALCPRTTLKKTLEEAASHDMSFLVGFEVEFVIMERGAESPQDYHTLSNDGHAWAMARTLSDWGREGSFATAIDEILDTLEKADIEIEQFHAEAAPGQFEIVLGALPPMEACDSLLHARQILESVSARHGFRMTLYPKPFAKAPGSASHMHLSISSPGGDNPKVYEAFYAGILQHLRAIIAFTYSNPASYERMVDSCWAGGRYVTWGTQNKEAPLRKCEDSHWEIKVIDGLANPYFFVAAILAAGTQGILHQTPLTWKDYSGDPAKLSESERKELGITTMFPANLNQALEALKRDAGLVNMLNEDLVQRYVDIKTAELEELEPMGVQERRRWVMERY